MSRADVSDPEIKSAMDALKSSASLKSWLMLGYAPKSDVVLKVVATGEDGLSEATEYLNDGKVLFFLVSFPVNNLRKLVYISWCGEGVTGMKKGLFNNHSNDVGFLFKGFHVQINARNEDDISEKDIMGRLQKATGASYDSGEKNQGKASHVPTSVSQGRTQAQQSNVKLAAANKTDYNKKDESAEFWTQQRETEEREKQAREQQQAKSKDYQRTEERNQFWAQQQASAPAPAPVARTQVNVQGNATAIKSRFEQPPAAQPAPAARPAPNRLPPSSFPSAKPTPAPAPAPKATPPAPAPTKPAYVPPPVHHEPEPEPEPEQQEWQEEPQQYYEEPQYDESQQQEWQDESQQQTYDESQQQQEWQDESQQQQYYEEPQHDESQQQQEWQDESQQQYYDESQNYQGGEEQQWGEQPQEQAYSSGGDTCRALYDYDGENADDLVFKEGDVITVLDKSDPSGWWQGELNGAVGYFPSNFVE